MCVTPVQIHSDRACGGGTLILIMVCYFCYAINNNKSGKLLSFQSQQQIHIQRDAAGE